MWREIEGEGWCRKFASRSSMRLEWLWGDTCEACEGSHVTTAVLSNVFVVRSEEVKPFSIFIIAECLQVLMSWMLRVACFGWHIFFISWLIKCPVGNYLTIWSYLELFWLTRLFNVFRYKNLDFRMFHNLTRTKQKYIWLRKRRTKCTRTEPKPRTKTHSLKGSCMGCHENSILLRKEHLHSEAFSLPEQHWETNACLIL